MLTFLIVEFVMDMEVTIIGYNVNTCTECDTLVGVREGCVDYTDIPNLREGD
jgi:hypothetical protein